MRFQPSLLLHLLAAAVTTPPLSMAAARSAATAYTPPPELLAKSQQTDGAGCVLPADYHIRNFAARSNGTGLAAYDFTFADEDTKTTTFCRFNSSAVSTTPPDLTPRYSCNDRDVKFIWTEEKRQLTMVERVCPGSNGTPNFEVSGSVLIYLSCGASGVCVANSTDYDARFFSISPVIDPTMRFAKKRMVA